ncbi:Fungal protein of unknown function (DUF1770) [Geosmithia morbida]|uniref:DUF1770-domain-containing protein n=1 Tax=Geosmithia morbida TaxID=1094350 RepID=A0A9P5D528_9HYPO|nr:Fungal protein of unknown function (DUF1770) [Geosmithia morbida]KAF4124141.1 Fungal protein of unknown function (DUF1770) [Geosmithia morbida]
MSSLPEQVAETIQTAHIAHNPDPAHDLAPATAADEKVPVSLSHEDDDVDSIDHEEDVPYSVLKPAPRSTKLPPMPDLRFEQSYLNSIASANTWWKVALITARDQVLMPLTQGVLYNLLICGWQHWNRNAQLQGNTMGVRLRRWWYGVNNWKIPNR